MCGPGRTSPDNLGKRNSFSDRIESIRETVRDRFKRVLGETPASGILAALAVGDQRAISAEEWRLFNRTGVTHLMSISGLHVTMVSGLFAWLAGWLWRRSPFLMLRLPARKAAALAAIAGALGYSLIAGFAVPAQRTFWMVTVVALALWAGRIAAPARTLALALAVVLVFDPWAVLSPGFWLSFGAVALIFFVATGEAVGGGAVAARAMGDHARPRAGGAVPVRAGFHRRPARQCGRHPAGVGGGDAARAARGGAALGRAARTGGLAAAVAAAVPGMVRGAAGGGMAAARAAALDRCCSRWPGSPGCSRRAACPGARRASR